MKEHVKTKLQDKSQANDDLDVFFDLIGDIIWIGGCLWGAMWLTSLFIP